ncbi:MAG: hypothetical protein IPK26_25845 [Planctomycetes bacterium]|nr:hypothetical protein [Planctomycetota bacterium]
MTNSSKDFLCRGCGGTIGDHLAPDQGGCPGAFYIDGVMVFPVANRDAEIARLRAENSSQNKALTMLATGIGNPPLAMFDEPIEDTLVKTALGEIARLRTELRRFEKQEPQP